MFTFQEISDLISGYKEADDEALDQELESILDTKIQFPEVPENLPEGKHRWIIRHEWGVSHVHCTT